MFGFSSSLQLLKTYGRLLKKQMFFNHFVNISVFLPEKKSKCLGTEVTPWLCLNVSIFIKFILHYFHLPSNKS